MSGGVSSRKNALQAFINSSDTFRVLFKISSATKFGIRSRPSRTILILDSSFNPPTLAHLRMCLSALSEPSLPSPKHLILLLAINNADKPTKPAAFEHRLTMMELFSSEILSSWRNHITFLAAQNQGNSIEPGEDSELEQLTLDVAVTSAPYFSDKVECISSSEKYPDDAEHVILTGFDTLIRILDPKYYDTERKLGALEGLFKKYRLRVSYRDGDQWGRRHDQDDYLARIGAGERDTEGAKREWVLERRIEMVEGRNDDDAVISSSKARDLVEQGDEKTWRQMLPSSIADWIKAQGLYLLEN